MNDNDNVVHDVITVGFGPAGIALATAIEDGEEEKTFSCKRLFLDQAIDSTWQREMLLPGTDVQHHFLRDFATPRNPRSRYTFPNYLKEKGRLFTYGHLGGNTGRIEWSDYVTWVAEQVSHHTRYQHKVTDIQPVIDANRIKLLKITARDVVEQEDVQFLTRNLVVSTGRKPKVPDCVHPYLGKHVFHSSVFKSRIKEINAASHPSFTVIGAGQNAIEIVLYLANHYPDSDINIVNRNTGFRLYDLGHFSNEVYFPDFVDYYHALEKSKRKQLFEEIKYTTFSAVDHDVSRELYVKIYEENIMGKNRIKLIKGSGVRQLKQVNDRYELLLEDVYNHSELSIQSDNVILCTGYLEEKIPSLLAPLEPYFIVDKDGDIITQRNYELKTVDSFEPGLFLNGMTESSHGISDAASFSMMALKAQTIMDQLKVRMQQTIELTNLVVTGGRE